jgi:hypothetical protein
MMMLDFLPFDDKAKADLSIIFYAILQMALWMFIFFIIASYFLEHSKKQPMFQVIDKPEAKL